MTGYEVARALCPCTVKVIHSGFSRYDPLDRAVHLSRSVAEGTGCEDLAVAAHEAAHAWQHHQIAPPFVLWDTWLVQSPSITLFLFSVTAVTLLWSLPWAILFGLLTAMCVAIRGAAIYWMERDASWRALELLRYHRFVAASDEERVQSYLKEMSRSYLRMMLGR